MMTESRLGVTEAGPTARATRQLEEECHICNADLAHLRGQLMARRPINPLNDRRPSVRKISPIWAFVLRADDGNRTRTVSLGTGLSRPPDHGLAGHERSCFVRDHLPRTGFDSPVGHATGTGRPVSASTECLLSLQLISRNLSSSRVIFGLMGQARTHETDCLATRVTVTFSTWGRREQSH